MPVEPFYVPWPSDNLHWCAELVRRGIYRFEGVDTGRVLFVFDDDTRAAMAALAMPPGTETFHADPHCALLLQAGVGAATVSKHLEESGHDFRTFELVIVDAEPGTLAVIDRVLSALTTHPSA